MQNQETIKKKRFVKISDKEPLTIACGAFTTFLWDDFIRKESPMVWILEESYNIKELSRFGKEVFDRLYLNDEVEWLVSLDDYENYFRQIVNGEIATLPKGFKPEYSFWWKIMDCLSKSTDWVELVSACRGSQFYAANNTIRIMESLANFIEETMQGNKLSDLLPGDKLQELRDKFEEAQGNGDITKAASFRVQAKEIIQKVNNTVENIQYELTNKTSETISEAAKETTEMQDTLAKLVGSQKSTFEKKPYEQQKQIYNSLKNNSKIKTITKALGSLRRSLLSRKRARLTKSKYESIVGATFSNNIQSAFPSELALAATQEGKALFALKYAEKSMLCKDYEAKEKNLDRGDIVLYLDVSGSMRGEEECWAKACCLVICEEAYRTNRKVLLKPFASTVGRATLLDSKDKEFLSCVGTVLDLDCNGGTNFSHLMTDWTRNEKLRAQGKIRAELPEAKVRNTDVIVLTDLRLGKLDPIKAEEVMKIKEQIGSEWTCLQMTDSSAFALFGEELEKTKVFDKHYKVGANNDNDTLDSLIETLK